jgi:hypothetical protein
MKKTSVMWFAAMAIAIAASSGCDRDPKESAKVPDVVNDHVSENDLYMQRLEQDVDLADPDSMLDDLNEQVGDNKANAEMARKNAVSGSPVVSRAVTPDAIPAVPAVVPEAETP